MRKQNLLNRILKNKNRLNFRLSPLKWFVILLVLLAIGSLLFRKQITGFLGQKINPSPIENQTEIASNTPQPQAEDTDNKIVKSTCVNEVREYIESIKDKQISNEKFVWYVNSKYRFCLAENGLTPEDLLSYPNGSGSNLTGQSNVQDAITKSFEESEQRELERKQECQQDLAKYSVCLAEYNAELTEYNSCKSDPRRSMCGFKPYNSCSKPICF